MTIQALRFAVATSIVASSVIALAGCGGTAVGEIRTGLPRSALVASCPLSLESVTPAEMQPGARFGPGGEFEQIGIITLGAAQGTDPMSEAVRQEVRPRACAMGGEVISPMMAGDGANRRGYGQTNIAFTVWAHQQRPAAPQAF
jgi:hypothetical protein